MISWLSRWWIESTQSAFKSIDSYFWIIERVQI